MGDELFEEIGREPESSIVLIGEVREDERAPGGFEVSVSAGRVLQSTGGVPDLTQGARRRLLLLSRRHLWLRSRRQWAIMRCGARSCCAPALLRRARLRSASTRRSSTPSACEGTSTLFEVDYFDEKAYLTQSGQLYAEASAMAFGKVYTFGPTFRAEKSKTRRHPH